MAINRPRIAAGPTIERRRVREEPVPFYRENTAPSSPLNDAPSYEGAVLVILSSYGSTGYEANMYIAVNLDGTLTWVVVDTGDWVNGYTGAPWDSFSQFPVG